MSSLNSRQRAHLRSLAHSLKPVVQVGAEGISDALLRSVMEAFHTRELLKVKVQDTAPLSPRDAADALVAALKNVEVPQVIGRTVVMYRPFTDDPGIRLPV